MKIVKIFEDIRSSERKDYQEYVKKEICRWIGLLVKLVIKDIKGGRAVKLIKQMRQTEGSLHYERVKIEVN